MNTESDKDRLESLLPVFERQVARFRKTKALFFFGQGGMLFGLVLIDSSYHHIGVYPSQYWWILGGAAVIGFFTCSLPGLEIRRQEITIRLIRHFGERAGLSEREVEKRINTIGRREARGGMLNPPLFAMVCLVFTICWIFLGVTAGIRWKLGIGVFFVLASVFGLIAFLADKFLRGKGR
jgi:hypothetical protein